MNPISQPLELQAAAMRVAGYAVVSQMKIMQIMARSAMELPMAPLHALRNTASEPAPAKPAAKRAAAPKPAAKPAPAKRASTAKKAQPNPAAGPDK